MTNYAIYYWWNHKEHKGYVGQSNNIKNRLTHYYNVMFKNTKPRKCEHENKMKSHPEDWDDVYILQYCESQDELNEMEPIWIQRMNTLYPNGYNIELGGKNSRKTNLMKKIYLYDKEYNEQEFNSITELSECLNVPIGSVSNALYAQSGHHVYKKIYVLSKEKLTKQQVGEQFNLQKEIIKISQTESSHAAAQKRQKKCICDQTGHIENSMKAMEEYYDLCRNAVSDVIRGRHKTAGGYTFSLID